MAGEFHHEPRSAGLFVPGLASTSVGDPALPKMPPPGRVNSTDSLQGTGPTPRKSLSFASPAPTDADSQPEEPETPCTLSYHPDNQLGLVESPVWGTSFLDKKPSSLEKTTSSPMPESEEVLSHDPPTAEKEPPPPTVPPAGSGDKGPDRTDTATAAAPAVPEEGGKRVVLEGTMYDDGTYWKRLICNWNLVF